VDTEARFGGDEFDVVVGDLTGLKSDACAQASAVAQKICGSLCEPYHIAVPQEGQADTDVVHRCTVSVGVALFLNQDCSGDEVLKWADLAMYEAKEAGGNAVRFFQEGSEACAHLAASRRQM